MNLTDIEINPSEALIYLDRYINDGSPSGFSEKYRTSKDTDPFGATKDFKLYSVKDAENNFEIYGTLLSDIPLQAKDFFVHPDMVNHPDLKGFNQVEQSFFSVAPTSSCRTVKILSRNSGDFIKLHYDAVIGRVNRKLNYRKAINGVQLSYKIKNAIEEKKITSQLCILQEPFAKVHINPIIKSHSDYWCFVWREEKPFGQCADKIIFQLPLFSFWSKDRNNPNSKILFAELESKWKEKSKDVLCQQLLEVLLQIYFELIINQGMQNEMNAQNISIGFDENWFPVAVIIKDLMGIEKDLTLMKEFNLPMSFDSDYKNIFEGMKGEENLYEKRHSLSFDFKFSYYIMKPLIDLGCNSKLFSEDEIIIHLKELTKQYLNKLPENYLSKNIWYNHDKELLTDETKRVYRKQTNPLLR